jgi:chromosome segregation ATPase
MSLSDIRAKLQNNWGTWDKSGDGKIEKEELFSAFDSNNDGILDKNEIQILAKQLSAQLEYNNSLLEQMRESEEMNLQAQRDLQAKDETLRKTTAALDEMQQELGECKRRLKVTQEIADSMSKQCKDARIEANTLKRDAENALKSQEDGKNMTKEMIDERNRLQKALKLAEESLAAEVEKSERDRVDLMHQNDILRQSHEALSLEAAELRSKVIPVEVERKSLKEHILSLATTLEQTTAKCESETQKKLECEKKIKDMTTAAESLKDKHREMQYMVQQANGKAEAAAAMIQQQNLQIKSLETQIAENESKITQLTKGMQQAQRDRESLEQELEQMGNELVAYAKQRQIEQDRWSNRLTAARSELTRESEETKARAEEFAMDAQKRAADAIQAQRRAEEKYLNIQTECSDLHSLIQQAQIDHQTAAAGWDGQRVEYEHQINSLQKSLELSEDEIENIHATLLVEREDHSKKIQDVKSEMISRGERYVAMLDTLQLAIKRLKENSIATREYIREVVAQFTVLKAFCDQLQEKSHPPLELWKVELSAAFKNVTNKFKALKEHIEDTKDDVRRAQLAKEEERSKTLMLEESVSRLEHELSSCDTKVRDVEGSYQDKIQHQKYRIDELMKEKAEFEARIQRVQQALDAATSQAKSLQQSNHSIQTSMGDSSAKHSAVQQEVQNKINQLTAQLKRAVSDRDQQSSLCEDLRVKLANSMKEISDAKKAVENATLELQKQKDESALANNKAAETINAVGGTTAQYQEQLRQTQELLRVCMIIYIYIL